MNENKHHPIADVVPVFEHEWNDYPDAVLIAMDNGQVIKYDFPVEQPHPAFKKVMHLIDSLPVYGGYKHDPEYELIKKIRRKR